MPPSSRAAAAGAADGFSGMSDIFDDLFGDIMGRRTGAFERRTRARRGPALQSRNHAGRGVRRQGRDAEDPDGGRLRGLRRHRRQARLEAGDLPHLRGPWPRPRATGLLRRRAHLPDLQRPRRTDRQAVREMPRRRPRDARAQPLDRRAGAASRTARASGSPARAKRGCAAAAPATSTSSSRSSRIRSSSATAPIFTAACRSRWCRRRSAANSARLRSTALRRRCACPKARSPASN